MFYDYRATTYKWLLPHNALSISDFTKINTSFANLNTTAFITVDSYSKNYHTYKIDVHKIDELIMTQLDRCK
jgi:hypothetical protein